MESDLLIDFNSPQKCEVNILNPLIPLPKVQARDIADNETISSVEDNPFDKVFLQLCREDDPFDVVEKKAQQNETNKIVIQDEQKFMKDMKMSSLENKSDNERVKSVNISVSQKSNAEESKTNFCGATSDFHTASFTFEKSLSESNLSPISERIDNKFSKLYLSAQFDKQLLDESSKCIDSGMQDISLNITPNFSPRVDKVCVVDIPNEENDIKAYIANRIEKCIEKAVTETRQSLNASFRHRRSLSATSLHPTLGSALNHNSISSANIRENVDKLLGSFTSKKRSLSNHDLLSTVDKNLWKSPVGGLSNDLDSNNFTTTCFSERLNNAFRKTTATSSMFSSCGLLETGFRKSSSAFSSFRKSASSLNFSLPHIGDDSVFSHNPANTNSADDCILMEAKNLSILLRQKAASDGDECLDCDNFLTNGKCDVELVDSDSSFSEDGNTDIISDLQLLVKDSDKSCSGKRDRMSENPTPLPRTEVAEPLNKKRSPFLGPPIPVPVNSAPNTKEFILRPKAKSDSQVVARGPMKAMIPLGHMVRRASDKEYAGSIKQGDGLGVKKLEIKTVLAENVLRRSSIKGSKVLESKRSGPTTSNKMNSPVPSSSRPVAYSTPSSENVSPPLGLQLSHISPSPVPDVGHRRSRSAGCRNQQLDVESRLTSTPSRNPPRRIRSEDGRIKSKIKSPELALTKKKPVYTSTPLRQIAKNSPPVNRMKRISPKMKKDTMEKENVPTRRLRVPHVLQRNTWKV